jgi:hypothetical protein
MSWRLDCRRDCAILNRGGRAPISFESACVAFCMTPASLRAPIVAALWLLLVWSRSQ